MSGRRWLVLGLALSLVINLVLIGFLIGRLSGMPRPPSFRANVPASIGWLMRNLPEERREMLRADAREHFRSTRPELRALRDAQRRLYEVLSAEKLDQQALNDVIAQLRTHLDAIQGANLALLGELAGKLSPQERHMLAEGLRRRPGGRSQEARSQRHPAPPPPDAP